MENPSSVPPTKPSKAPATNHSTSAHSSTIAIFDFVEVYENERYNPIGGWAASSLLPTDRGAFSTKDGTCGWATLAEAESACLSTGWEWDKDSIWTPNALTACDGEGVETFYFSR
jgi:hypothetical protein